MREKKLSRALLEKIRRDEHLRVLDYSTGNESAIRRKENGDLSGNILKPAFSLDVEKIMHLPHYNRYADKTQVFSFFHNDDITRRALHVQLVSRIARDMGRLLGLNLDLIEAIALGHDIGHTPFGHAGEAILNELYHRETGRWFNHNVQSVRVLDTIFGANLTLQTLDGVLCHNGALLSRYENRSQIKDFATFDETLDECAMLGKLKIGSLAPSTLEGALVRICDMLAYVGKDREDAVKAHIIPVERLSEFTDDVRDHATFLQNVAVDIVIHSYGRDYIGIGEEMLSQLIRMKKENNEVIYKNASILEKYDETVKPMFEALYERLLDDVRLKRQKSVIFDHHVDFVMKNRMDKDAPDYSGEEPNRIVTDFISSMTDDYFIALYRHLFPEGPHHVDYVSYFQR